MFIHFISNLGFAHYKDINSVPYTETPEASGCVEGASMYKKVNNAWEAGDDVHMQLRRKGDVICRTYSYRGYMEGVYNIYWLKRDYMIIDISSDRFHGWKKRQRKAARNIYDIFGEDDKARKRKVWKKFVCDTL